MIIDLSTPASLDDARLQQKQTETKWHEAEVCLQLRGVRAHTRNMHITRKHICV